MISILDWFYMEHHTFDEGEKYCEQCINDVYNMYITICTGSIRFNYDLPHLLN